MANMRAMKLGEYLKDMKLRPSAFAEAIGVSPSTITRLLKGEREPRLALVMLIRDATGGRVTPEDFAESPRQPEAAE